MIGRGALRALVAFSMIGWLSSGSCHVRACSGDCNDAHHDHDLVARGDRIGNHRGHLEGLPPGEVTRLLTRIHGPWLLPEERLEARLRAAFAGRVLAANRALLGLGETAELAFESRVRGNDLLLESHVRDSSGPCRITLRIEPGGRLSAIRVQRPGL